MGLQDFFNWRPQANPSMSATADDDISADADEPPDDEFPRSQPLAVSQFSKAAIRPRSSRQESLLTKAFQSLPNEENYNHNLSANTEYMRRRSMMSNASLASTAELTSDGGLTSPARTNTPSPPFPDTMFANFPPYSFSGKSIPNQSTLIPNQLSEIVSVSPKAEVAPAPRKRCITFVCDGKRDMPARAKAVTSAPAEPVVAPVPVAPKPRQCMIKFACEGGPRATAKAKNNASNNQGLKPTETGKRSSRSPSMTRKSSRLSTAAARIARRSSQSPVAVRAKPKYIIADEKTIETSDATRFHEFASGILRDDDWIQKDAEVQGKKLTINDTLKMENAIRKLGNEAEEEALEEDDDEDDDDEDEDVDSDDENDVDEDEDDENGSDEDEASDGNETDNEAGFADSDDESDATGDFAFWTPGRKISAREPREPQTYRASAHRAASASSIDSLDYMEPAMRGRRQRRRPIRIRPGTPDLPDSTDFVCGTLDEDRPLEDAYVSCMEARKYANHKQTPQDIDPSFPTSDPEDEEDDEDIVEAENDSEDHVWLHGQFEESDDDRHDRRRSTAQRKSPVHSPRRLHSPPPPRRIHSPAPAKHRLRSPPPRKLFGQSPRRMRSPPPARATHSPHTSPTHHSTSQGITFEPLGARPGLTHTKSLPRTPNAFCRQYNASRLIAANGNWDGNDAEGHMRGAIDIVKGLEHKRQRRKEKLYRKQCDRKNKTHIERRPQPGKGAERMRELGLLMAGKTGQTDPYMLSA